ncbi:MAG: LLM class flavin-dependent oxidoreductase, partial [Chloroflexia bacterium]
DAKVRGAMLDEGLQVLTGLWSGRPFSFDGQYYKVRETTFLPPPAQSPRIPIWVAGYWPNKPPMRRAASWDGVFPILRDDESVSPEQLRDLLSYIKGYRESDGPFEVVCSGVTRGDDPTEDASIITPLAEAGATWWVENTIPERFVSGKSAVEQMRERIVKGPPRL